MGKRIQKLKAIEDARVARIEQSLRARREPVLTKSREDIAREVISGFEHLAYRSPDTWAVKLKTKDTTKIATTFARYVFGKYPVAYHLEQAFIAPEPLGDNAKAVWRERRSWYVCVATGRSLYKDHVKTFLTKMETHWFLNPPVRLTLIEAIWYAIARTHTDDHGRCLQICRSKIAGDSVSPFWKDAARFFCLNPASMNEINDLVDYFKNCLRENPNYSLKGRKLPALKIQMEAWHRHLARMEKIGYGHWEGFDMKDFSYFEENHDKPYMSKTFRITQIKTGKELAEEGTKQRHCVSTYKSQCMSGRTSIWSMKVADHTGTSRLLTIQLDRSLTVVQVRGYANRLAKPEEKTILKKWMATFGGTISSYYG